MLDGVSKLAAVPRAKFVIVSKQSFLSSTPLTWFITATTSLRLQAVRVDDGDMSWCDGVPLFRALVVALVRIPM